MEEKDLEAFCKVHVPAEKEAPSRTEDALRNENLSRKHDPLRTKAGELTDLWGIPIAEIHKNTSQDGDKEASDESNDVKKQRLKELEQQKFWEEYDRMRHRSSKETIR